MGGPGSGRIMRPRCQHGCGRVASKHKRGLCFRCYHTPEVREKYQSYSRYAHRGHGNDMIAATDSAPAQSFATVNAPPPDHLTLAEVAAAFGVSPNLACSWVRSGRLPAVYVNQPDLGPKYRRVWQRAMVPASAVVGKTRADLPKSGTYFLLRPFAASVSIHRESRYVDHCGLTLQYVGQLQPSYKLGETDLEARLREYEERAAAGVPLFGAA